MRYIIIPKVRVQCANAMACNFVINSAPMFATVMMGHAIQENTGINIEKAALVVHDAELLAENQAPFYRGQYMPQQRMGATLIDKTDYAGQGFAPGLSLQPVVDQHLLVTLVFASSSPAIDLAKLQRFLGNGRLAGGTITGHEPIGILDSEDEVLKTLRSGFWVVSRPDLLTHGMGMLEEFVLNITNMDRSWVTPIVCGYAAITGLEYRDGVRTVPNNENPCSPSIPLHAFTEPLVGLGQFISVNQYSEQHVPFWQQARPRPDVWVIEQVEILEQSHEQD